MNIAPIKNAAALSAIGTILVLSLILPKASVLAQSGGTKLDRPEQWALLIGVEKYYRASALPGTTNDVRELARALELRGGYGTNNMLQMTDANPNPRLKPLRSNLMSEIQQFLSRPAPADRVLLFFSGHGFRDPQDGALYLAPLDCDPANPAATGVSVAWLRDQLSRCNACFKLLVIDACHAGTEKGSDDASSVAAKDLAEEFQHASSVVTLASSASDEKSQLWLDKDHSLFTYWLIQALKGHADADLSGSIEIDELYSYVRDKVAFTAEQSFPHKQSPRRIIGSGVDGNPTVLQLVPARLDQVLQDMGDQLAWNMQQHDLPRAGVIEFTDETLYGTEVLGGDFGTLGWFCADKLTENLLLASNRNFTVVDPKRMIQMLRSKSFAIEGLSSPRELRGLGEQFEGGLPAIINGKFRGRRGSVVHLRCELRETTTGDLLGVAAGAAMLDDGHWAMLGRSAEITAEDRRHSQRQAEAARQEHGVFRPVSHEDDHLIRHLDQRAQGPHPLRDPLFPYRVEIMVQDRKNKSLYRNRQGTFHNNDYYVPLNKDEVFRIHVTNTSDSVIVMRLLVDGLNTLPETVDFQGVNALKAGHRVDLSIARHWVLSPRKLYAVPGFFQRIGEESPFTEFQVVDAVNSLAARQNFTDQLGIITAAFYAPAEGARDIGIGEGRTLHKDVPLAGKEYAEVGPPLAYLNIRYVEPAALAGLK